jgi:O-antigen/teichoic acid export membrane protein
MLQKISSIIKGSYLRNIFTLSIGSIAAQFIVVVFSPILTRIYSPEEMGNYTLLLSISAIFIPILSLRYEIAITKADEKNVKATIMASFYIACIIIVILTIISLALFILKVRLLSFLITKNVSTDANSNSQI